MEQPLAGKKIAVLMETEYIPEEIRCYQERFTELGATVDFMSRLWGNPSMTFVSDVDSINKPLEEFTVSIDFETVDVNQYAAVLMAANYCSVRLRYFQPPAGAPISAADVKEAPAVKFFAQAMANPRIIKEALCHALWILTPRPDLLAGRKVICHEVVLADILNAGAIYTPSSSGVVVDLANNLRVHDIILSFLNAGKPIGAECYGVSCLAFARDFEERKSIIWGKHVTGHCKEYDYKDGTGFLGVDFNMGPPP